MLPPNPRPRTSAEKQIITLMDLDGFADQPQMGDRMQPALFKILEYIKFLRSQVPKEKPSTPQ